MRRFFDEHYSVLLCIAGFAGGLFWDSIMGGWVEWD